MMVRDRTGASSEQPAARTTPSGAPTVRVPVTAAIETTELRWFLDGVLPPSVRSWFTEDGALGVVEERCDLYQLGHGADIGVKLRARSVLELKLRQSTTVIAPAASGKHDTTSLPGGTLEVWRKWRPTDNPVDSRSEPWVEIRKTIVKRRFTIDGEEAPVLDLATTPVGAFCDVEIVAIGDGAASAWSFAFAANGPVASRLPAIETAWRTLLSVTAPAPRSLRFGVSCGYPEWLERRQVCRSSAPGSDRSCLGGTAATADAHLPDTRTDRAGSES